MVINNESKQTCLLGELKPGTRAEIIGFETASAGSEGFLQRLFEVGFLEGAELIVLNQAPYSGDPISIRIKDATYALRRNEANLVKVKLL